MLVYQPSECVVHIQAMLAEQHLYIKTQWGKVRLFAQIVLLMPMRHSVGLNSVIILVSTAGWK